MESGKDLRYFVTFVQSNEWRSANTGYRYRGELEDHGKNLIFGITDFGKYIQDLSGLEKK